MNTQLYSEFPLSHVRTPPRTVVRLHSVVSIILAPEQTFGARNRLSQHHPGTRPPSPMPVAVATNFPYVAVAYTSRVCGSYYTIIPDLLTVNLNDSAGAGWHVRSCGWCAHTHTHIYHPNCHVRMPTIIIVYDQIAFCAHQQPTNTHHCQYRMPNSLFRPAVSHSPHNATYARTQRIKIMEEWHVRTVCVCVYECVRANAIRFPSTCCAAAQDKKRHARTHEDNWIRIIHL